MIKMMVVNNIQSRAAVAAVRAIAFSILLLCSQGAVRGFSSDPKEVDLTTVYRFGDYEVSRYLLDKNFNLFSETTIREAGRTPSAEDTRAWFELFVAQQALIAELRGDGYDKKPEVERIVRSMESYMLSSEEGPLYEVLMRERGIMEPNLHDERANSRIVFDGIVVRLPVGAEETAQFALALESMPEAEKRSSLEEAVRSGVVDGWDGELVWPYNPYLDVRSLLANSAAGEVYGPVHSDLGVYYYYKRKQLERESPVLPGDDDQEMRLLRKIDRDVFIQARRAGILSSADVRIDLALAASMLNSFPPDSGRLPEIDMDSLAIDLAAPLAVYRVGEEEVEVSVFGFCDYYNSRMMRSIPGDLEDLKALVLDRVLSEFDRLEAERLGLMNDPRFVENRKNFENGQILSHYIERDLAEQVRVTDEDVKSRYLESQEMYTRLDAVEATLAIFPSQKKALESLSGGGDPEAEFSTIVVRADAPSNPFPLPLDVLMTLPEGQPLGPFAYEGGYAMFRKVKELSRSALPLEKVESGIRRDLIQRKADDFIKSRFASRVAVSGFQELLDYSRYGIASPFVSLAKGTDGSCRAD